MTHTLGDAPIDAKYRDQMNDLARFIDQIFNGNDKGEDRKVGFVLMTFPFGDGEGRVNYISNGERKDVVATMKQQIARFEGQPDVKGSA